MWIARRENNMHNSLSTTGIFDLSNPGRYMRYITDAGFGSMMLDLGMFYTGYDLENYKTKRSTVNEKRLFDHFSLLVKQARNHAICFEAVRTPCIRWDTKRTDLNDLILQIGEQSIRVCKELDCHFIIVQPLFSGISRCDRWKANFEFYLRLGRLAKVNSICILLENQCENVNGHIVRGMCADSSMTVRLIDELNHELGSESFGFCLNTEACDLCGQDMAEMTVEFGKRLKAVLVKECDDVYRVGRLPCVGGSNRKWYALIQGLRKIEYDGMLIMDAGDALRGFSHLLRPQLYTIIKSVSDFFCWQIEIEKQLKRYPTRVLFGAGKMCQNYIKYYGELYPPLFVCDNNSRIWGTQVCGLDVKSPEALRNLSEDCWVIICNVFYEEIKKQLIAMGVRNIGTFNDEYMTETDGFG